MEGKQDVSNFDTMGSNDGNNDCVVKDGYFVNKAVTNLFKCIKCNDIPYPCYSISNKNKFICGMCKSLNDYINMEINIESALTAVVGTAIVYCLNNNINDINYNNNSNYNEGWIIKTSNDEGNKIKGNDDDIKKQCCKWKGQLSQWNEHNNKCELSLIVCEYCNDKKNKILRNDLNKHYSICDEYLIKCTNYSCDKIVKRKNMNNHCKNECEYAIISCKNTGCNVIRIKKEFNEHKNECPKRIIDCPYKEYGCNARIIFDELNTHNNDYALQHCDCLSHALKHEKSKNKNHNSVVERLQANIQKQDKIIDTFHSSMEEKRASLENLKIECEVHKQKSQSLEAKFEEKDTELSLLRRNSTHNMGKKDEIITDLKIQLEITKNKLAKYQNVQTMLGLHNDDKMELKSNILYSYDYMILNDKSILTTNGYDSNSQKGGVLLLEVKRDIIINDNSQINLNGLGYKGGAIKKQGHSYKGNSVKSSENNYGGGGSVYKLTTYCGAGGGYGTKGKSIGAAKPGECYGDNDLGVLYLGSGGGGSEYYKGGNGGGSIKIECNKLIINKNCGIYCNGNNGDPDYSGGGSGGSIHIICNELINYGNIHAKGGISYNGGNGGFGRIRIDCNKITKKGNIVPDIGYNKYNKKRFIWN